ncbi:MAG TPA: molybdopterin oxidoreductase family protein [Sedimenticola sp.]|nr:molybdopterin oxidoreductase family protein [Sedimenticola sp.]
MTVEFVPSVCPHDCPSACALEVERLDRRTIGRVRGARANDYTRGVICAKVARYAERVHHPERLTRPLRRVGARGSGRFEPMDWDEALDRVAENLQRVASRHGPEAVWPYYYAGTMGQLQRDGINRLRHVMGYSRQRKTICTELAYAGWRAGVGQVRGADPREMSESDLIVIWGCNPVATQINVMTRVSDARRDRAARLVVVDPCRTATAEKADLHLALRPGTDGALAAAVMQVLLQEGYADRDYMARYTDFNPETARHLAGCSPEWAEPITGVAAAEIRAFARLYGATPRSFIRLGIGFSRSRNGAHNVHAVSCLPAVTGAWQHRGGGALLGTSDLFHLDKGLIEGLDALDPATRELDMSRIGPVLCGEPEALAGGGPVHALFIQNSNPMAVAPELAKVHRGFAREDLFICVHEQFLTETARMADIVLPATAFLEHHDLYQSYGQVHLQYGPPVIEAPEACRSNHRVIQGLARRLGAKHPAFDMGEEELLDATLRASGYPGLAQLREVRWFDCSRPFREMHFLDGFGWPDGRFRFAPEWDALGPLGAGMPRLPGHWAVIDEAEGAHPFRLVTPPARNFLNTTFTETPTSRSKEVSPRLQIHPDDAAVLGIGARDRVRVGNLRGALALEARVTRAVRPGVVSVEGTWPGDAFPGGVGINLLTSADPGAPSGGAVFHDTAVWVERGWETEAGKRSGDAGVRAG